MHLEPGKQELRRILKKFGRIFTHGDEIPPNARVPEVHIEVTGSPVRIRSRQMPVHKLNFTEYETK